MMKPKMSAGWRRRTTHAFCLLLTVCLFCAAAAGCGKKPHRFTLEDDGALCRDTVSGIGYRAAGFDIVADRVGEIYARFEQEQFVIDLNRAEGLDPDKWLADDDGYLFYAEGVYCPTLSDFAGEGVVLTVCDSNGKTIATVTDTETVSTVAETFAVSSRFSRPTAAAVARYDLYLASPLFPAMRYHVLCYTYDAVKTFGVGAGGEPIAGRAVLFSRQDGICVVLPESLTEWIPIAE